MPPTAGPYTWRSRRRLLRLGAVSAVGACCLIVWAELGRGLGGRRVTWTPNAVPKRVQDRWRALHQTRNTNTSLGDSGARTSDSALQWIRPADTDGQPVLHQDAITEPRLSTTASSRYSHTTGINRTSVVNNVNISRHWDTRASISVSPDGACDDQFRSRHYMTVSRKEGRLGNDLFQLAMLLATARRYCYTPVVPWSFGALLRHAFTVPNYLYQQADLANLRDFDDWACCRSVSIYNRNITHLSTNYNWTFRGYFQSYRYFSDQADFIRSRIKFEPSVIDIVSPVLKGVTEELGDVTIVGVHVRRGDMAHDSWLFDSGFAVAGADYIRTAMSYFRRLFQRLLFIVASDELQWCRDSVPGDDVIFSPLTEPAHDLALLANCHHVIITSGSFGWWAAWLNGGIVVYFKGFPADGSRVGSMYNKTDYYPHHWIGVG